MTVSLAQKITPFCSALIALALLVSSGAANQDTYILSKQKSPNDKVKVRITRNKSMTPASTIDITAVRNLDSENWLQDLELEVKNNFRKPVYFLKVMLILPEIVSTANDGRQTTYGVPIMYGREDLSKIDNLATSEDVPINPGGIVVLKVAERYRESIESHLTRRSIPISTIKTIRFHILRLSFGDGTGIEVGQLIGIPRRSSNNLPPQGSSTIVLREANTRKSAALKTIGFNPSPRCPSRRSSR